MPEENEYKTSILVVDDEPEVSRTVRRSLLSVTDDIVVANSGYEALDACLSRSFDLVISDMRMPGMNGVDLMRLLAHDYPSMRRIILTAYADLEQTMGAINAGRVHRYLTKPWKHNELAEVITEELRIYEKERSEIIRLRTAIEQLSDK
jgi:response regulator RpfG family c-di-GMP phosphodiesterase